mgnify:CR=1 FL=1
MMKYVFIVCLGAISYGMLSSFAKIAYGQGYSAAEITFMQALLGTLMLWVMVFFQKIKITRQRPPRGQVSQLLAGLFTFHEPVPF